MRQVIWSVYEQIGHQVSEHVTASAFMSSTWQHEHMPAAVAPLEQEHSPAVPAAKEDFQIATCTDQLVSRGGHSCLCSS